MATTTPNLGLTLPTGTEKVSRQIINDNNTKIDTAVGKQTVETGNVTLASRVTSGTLDTYQTSCKKIGNIVNASGRVHTIAANTVTANSTFFVIPSGFRPSTKQFGFGYVRTQDNAEHPLLVEVDTNGNVGISYSSMQYANQVGFAITYHI